MKSPYSMSVFAICAGLTALPLMAETAPKAGSRDARVTYATYQEGQVYRLTTRLRTVTLVELGDGEKIQSIAIGDLESFKIDKLERQNLFIIKPVIPGASTNLTVETQKNIYFLQVRESAKGNPQYSVKFTTPSMGRSANAASDMPASVPFSYKVMKKRKKLPSFAPVAISDDGRKTSFKIPAGAPMPVVLRADAKGQEYSVNSAVRGTTITVSTRSERWVLRYGDDYVCVTAEVGSEQ